MSDSLEPPAKRARLEADAPIYGASLSALDAPGSPVDDLDDDFYDNSPAKPSAPPAVHGTPSVLAAAAPAPLGFHLPGLGAVGSASVSQTALHQLASPQDDATPDEGELSDDEAFYEDASVVAPAAANQQQTVGDAPPHDAAAADTDDELDAALTAAIEQQNESIAQEDAAAAQASQAAIIDSKLAFLQAAEANRDNKDAEWQLDSDASDSDSSSDSSSSDEGSDDGELLDPEEQVRLLLQEALEEEPGAAGKAKVKTLNEVDEHYEKPDIKVTEQTNITELGHVESVVENLVLIKAKNSGDEQVLESGSALCLQNRTVIGKISEQIGRVEEPRYALGFNDAAEISTLGIEKDTPIYYVNDHSTFVLTEPLRNQKHTDASNLHDEETNDVEFSDDEKEAEYKREQKAKKRARTEGNDDASPTISLPIPTGPRGHVDAPVTYRSLEYQGGGLKYSDDEDEDLGMYKPLARPDHFEQIVGHGAPLEDRSHVRRGMGRGRGPWGDRGRGFRGRGGGFPGRGDFQAGQGNRGGYAAGRGDFGGGRGERGGQGNRGGSNNSRGGRVPKGQADRGGRQQEPFQNRQPNQPKNSGQHDGGSVASGSPSRQQQDMKRSQSQQGREQSQTHQSPPTGSKNKNRKQRQREKRERERLQQQQQQQQQHGQHGQQHGQHGQQHGQHGQQHGQHGQQHGQHGQHGQQQQKSKQAQQQQPALKKQHASPPPPPLGPSNSNAYASNHRSGWPAPYSAPAPSVAPFLPAGAAPAPAPAPAAPYSYAGAFATPAPAPTQAPVGQPQQQQANVAAWAQWFQLVGAMSQQQAAAGAPPPPVQAQAPPPPPPPPPAVGHQQGPGQYSYPYQPYGQGAPSGNAPSQGNAQPNAQSLQDILRALGGGGGAQ